MAENSEPKTDLPGSAKRVFAALLAILQNRLELFLVECEEEKRRLLALLVWTFAAFALGAITVLLATFTLIYAFWEKAPLATLIAVCAAYAAATAWACRAVQIRLKNSAPFSATLNELQKDQSCLDPKP